jgi:hypothetical protein
MVLAVSGLCRRRSLLTRCVDAPGTSEWYVKESSRLSDQSASGRGTMALRAAVQQDVPGQVVEGRG